MRTASSDWAPRVFSDNLFFNSLSKLKGRKKQNALILWFRRLRWNIVEDERRYRSGQTMSVTPHSVRYGRGTRKSKRSAVTANEKDHVTYLALRCSIFAFGNWLMNVLWSGKS
jgi:hypothetical protein